MLILYQCVEEKYHYDLGYGIFGGMDALGPPIRAALFAKEAFAFVFVRARVYINKV